MNSLPTASSGVTTLSNTAVKVATLKANNDEIRPAAGAVQFGDWLPCLRGADWSISGVSAWLLFGLLKISMERSLVSW